MRERGQFVIASATGKTKAEETRTQEGKCPKLEAALTIWLFDKETQNGTVTDAH